jgi:DNA-binding ferritin-like protein (Dps family)
MNKKLQKVYDNHRELFINSSPGRFMELFDDIIEVLKEGVVDDAHIEEVILDGIESSAESLRGK